MLTFGSTFAGIEGFGAGFEAAGMKCLWQVEKESDCRSVMARHFPDAERFNDVREVGRHNLKSVDIITGGFPCQDLSVAGKRSGLAGERSGLFYQLVRITDELKPSLLVWENVPGLISSDNGRDFARVLRALDDIGYSGAWTGLDAQWFGVAQRRRRIFGVFARADIGAARCAEILSLGSGLRRHPPARGEAGAHVARTITGGTRGGSSHGKPSGTDRAELVAGCFNGYTGGADDNDAQGSHIVGVDLQNTRLSGNVGGALDLARPSHGGGQAVMVGVTNFGERDTSTSPTSSQQRIDPDTETLVVTAFNIQQNDGGPHKRRDRPNGGLYVKETDTALTVGTTDLTAIAFNWQGSGTQTTLGADSEKTSCLQVGQTPAIAFDTYNQSVDSVTQTLRDPNGTFGDALPAVFQESQTGVREYDTAGCVRADAPGSQASGSLLRLGMGVRRLTPRECERLQGFPDDWTLYGADGEVISDSARYRMLGNAVADPCAKWIGRRIVEVMASMPLLNTEAA